MLSGCYRGVGTGNPENTRGAPFAPWGVVAAPRSSWGTTVGGLYLSPTRYECCGLAQDAILQVMTGRSSRRLYLHFYVPNFQTLTRKPQLDQAVDVRFSPKRHSYVAKLKPDSTYSISMPIPSEARMRGGLLEVKLHMRYAITPARYSADADTRSYSIILTEAETGP